MTAPDPLEPAAVLTTAEAAALLRISERHYRDLINEGRVPGVKFGRLWRVPRVQLDALLAGRQTNP